MFDQEQSQPVLQFRALANTGVLATAHAITESECPLTARTLRNRCEHVRRRPGRTVRSWLLMMYFADLLERTRAKGAWFYWPTDRLRELLRVGGVSDSTFLPPVRPLVPNASMFKADGPEALEPGYADPE